MKLLLLVVCLGAATAEAPPKLLTGGAIMPDGSVGCQNWNNFEHIDGKPEGHCDCVAKANVELVGEQCVCKSGYSETQPCQKHIEFHSPPCQVTLRQRAPQNRSQGPWTWV